MLDILRPRVFQGSGALLIRAYPVFHWNSRVLRNGFDWSQRIDAALLLTPLERASQSRHVRWGIYAANDIGHSYGMIDDWIVDVPNCDVFLHLTPIREIPGVYMIASTCRLVLAADTPLRPLVSVEDGRHCDDHMLTSRLIMVQPHQLLFLKSWEWVMFGNPSLQPVADLRSGLSSMDLMQYGLWFASLEAGGARSQGASSSTHDFEPAIKAVSRYLDRWANLALWDDICEILDVANWQQLMGTFEKLRKDIISKINSLLVTAPRGDDHQTETAWYSHCHTRRELFEQLHRQLKNPVYHLMGAISRASLSGLIGQTMCLGRFKLAEVAGLLHKAVDEIPEAWTVDQFREHESDVFREWDEFTSHLRFLYHAEAECAGIRSKFVQRQVLRRLYTRAEPREFLII